MPLSKVTRLRRKRIVDRYKTMKGCTDCGYNSHACAIDLDHLPQFNKFKSVSEMLKSSSTSYSWDKVKEEIFKCEVVCACCHRERTRGRLDT